MRKIKKIFSWKSFKNDIAELGFSFSLKNFLISVLAMFTFIILTALLYKVEVVYLVILMALGIFLTPSIIKSRFISKYEEKRFMDICSYMEQVCSSFLKQSKILPALKDARLILDGKLERLVDESARYIEKGISNEDNIYTESLDIIEKDYSCKRLNSLHKFLVKIELSGGSYYNSMNILLQDLHSWTERTVIFQKNRKTIQINYIAVLILSVLSCTLATLLSYISIDQNNFLSAYLNITDNQIYQLMTVLFISSCLISFALIQRRLSGSWLDQSTNEDLIMKDYEITLSYNYKKKTLLRLPFLAVMIMASISLSMFKIYIYSFVPMFIGVLYCLFPIVKYNGARKRTIQEIKMAFPEWLREITLNSQYQTIQMAIQTSLESTPKILKNSIEKLISDLEQNPSGIVPYNNFLADFDLPEVKSAMRILYSMSELSYDKSQEMLEVLYKQNYILIDKAENAYYQNKLLLLKQLLYLPMIFSMCKIMVDLFLFANSFFNGFSDLNNFIL